MNAHTPLAVSIEAFLRYLKVERQLSPLTCLSYRRQLTAILQIAEDMALSSWAAWPEA